MLFSLKEAAEGRSYCCHWHGRPSQILLRGAQSSAKREWTHIETWEILLRYRDLVI